MARIATRTAKPNGQYHITPERVCFGVFCYLFITEYTGERKCMRENFVQVREYEIEPVID